MQFLNIFLNKTIKSISNNVLNSEAPLEAFSLKSGAKHKMSSSSSSSSFSTDLQILVGVMRQESKLIGLATRKTQNYYLQMTRTIKTKKENKRLPQNKIL